VGVFEVHGRGTMELVLLRVASGREKERLPRPRLGVVVGDVHIDTDEASAV